MQQFRFLFANIGKGDLLLKNVKKTLNFEKKSEPRRKNLEVQFQDNVRESTTPNRGLRCFKSILPLNFILQTEI